MYAAIKSDAKHGSDWLEQGSSFFSASVAWEYRSNWLAESYLLHNEYVLAVKLMMCGS